MQKYAYIILLVLHSWVHIDRIWVLKMFTFNFLSIFFFKMDANIMSEWNHSPFRSGWFDDKFYSHFFNTYYYNYRWIMSSRFSSNSEASASKLLENLEEMFICYYMGGAVISRLKFVIKKDGRHNYVSICHELCKEKKNRFFSPCFRSVFDPSWAKRTENLVLEWKEQF